MPGNKLDPVTRQLIGQGHRAGGIAAVVLDEELKGIAEQSASGVDVGNGLFRASAHLFAEDLIFPAHRADNGNLDLSFRGGRHGGKTNQSRNDIRDQFHS